MNAAIVISDKDNVATALDVLEVGLTLRAGGSTVTVVEPIPRGHKVALRAIAAGALVVKYGSPIGTASSDIAPGAHVHTHNVASARGRGDLADLRRAALSGLRSPEDDTSFGQARRSAGGAEAAGSPGVGDGHHERGRIAEPADQDPADPAAPEA